MKFGIGILYEKLWTANYT